MVLKKRKPLRLISGLIIEMWKNITLMYGMIGIHRTAP